MLKQFFQVLFLHDLYQFAVLLFLHFVQDDQQKCEQLVCLYLNNKETLKKSIGCFMWSLQNNYKRKILAKVVILGALRSGLLTQTFGQLFQKINFLGMLVTQKR